MHENLVFISFKLRLCGCLLRGHLGSWVDCSGVRGLCMPFASLADVPALNMGEGRVIDDAETMRRRAMIIAVQL